MTKNIKVIEDIKVVCIANTFFGEFKKGEIYTIKKQYSITTRRKLICNIQYKLSYIEFYGPFTYQLTFYERSKNMFEKFSDFFITLQEFRDKQIKEILE